MTKLSDLHYQWRHDPAYQSAYDALEEEFSRAAILSGSGRNGSQDCPSARILALRQALNNGETSGSAEYSLSSLLEELDGDHSDDNLLQQDQRCSSMQGTTQYVNLEIVASLPETEIWLGDADGFFVQKALGKLITRLLSGDYVVEFGLGTPVYPIHLDKDKSTTQAELQAGPVCARQVFSLPE
ncbi:hypothetical protein [uncultured Thiodictyon sp.]|uniref:hypothetical protein n=1 Tax=uncultured Thiodictyon sp. TaxID=1846217 RepID=UPI0025D9FBB4|nr:hypothetical protein [uncultured Thiodictyon sp.]